MLSESANNLAPPTAPHSLGNLSSLDTANDDELPTDPSNSSDTQEESKWPRQGPWLGSVVCLFVADINVRSHVQVECPHSNIHPNIPKVVCVRCKKKGKI